MENAEAQHTMREIAASYERLAQRLMESAGRAVGPLGFPARQCE